MNLYRYLVIKYKSQQVDKPEVNIGIIIQSDTEITCKINNDIQRVKNVIGDEPIDKLIFTNLEDTFQRNFEEGYYTVTDKVTGEQKQVPYTDPAYLDYLKTNFLNGYYFNNKGVLEAEDINNGLSRLYKIFVDPSFNG